MTEKEPAEHPCDLPPHPGVQYQVRGGDRIRRFLKPLRVGERRLHPEVECARQNAFVERQDALYVGLIDGLMVKFSYGERQRSRSSVVNSILTRELKRLGFDPYPKEGSK